MNTSDKSGSNAVLSEKEKFLDSIRAKKKLGLVDIKFCTNINTATVVEEHVYAELNRMDRAKDIPDPEVLGEFSPVVA